ncbi:hypothetical protein [Pseudomonas sp. EpS/L25]|uniref:hypothetical protein n=1 Tax=Pseudomonas sp. EpS/L25 TaxID=1749078 RepID=UPI0007436393|nr:hypothetical protein [Pseudomonas sp. EpS/L25]KUM43359.1 hypothetical protein AR540_24205 [Pseudomonas sp. EpS/L25]
MTVTLKDLGDTLTIAQKQLAEMVAAQAPTPTPTPEPPAASLPLNTVIRDYAEKMLVVSANPLIVAGKVVVQLANGQAVNVTQVADASPLGGSMVLIIDQAMGSQRLFGSATPSLRQRRCPRRQW